MSENNDIAKVKALRDATGLSFNEIKKALDESGGDEQRALEHLKAFGATLAEKKSGRELKSGVIESYVHTDKKSGALIELSCETDFVARNEEFRRLARDLAMHAVAMRPANVQEMLEQPFVKNPDVSVKGLITQAVAKIGENIQLAGFSVLALE